MCVGARALRARSAALSKVSVRTEQNNFAGGGAVAGLVLRAPVEQMLWAPKTHHDILYRMLRTRQKAAPRRSPESWGAQNVPRNRAGKCRDAASARTVCAAAGARWEDERRLQRDTNRQSWNIGFVLPVMCNLMDGLVQVAAAAVHKQRNLMRRSIITFEERPNT